MAVEREMLSGPAQGGEQREKSSVIASPAIVRSSAILSGSSMMPSLSRKSSKRVGAVRQLRDVARASAPRRGRAAAPMRGRDGRVAVFVEQTRAGGARRDRAR